MFTSPEWLAIDQGRIAAEVDQSEALAIEDDTRLLARDMTFRIRQAEFVALLASYSSTALVEIERQWLLRRRAVDTDDGDSQDCSRFNRRTTWLNVFIILSSG